MFHKSVLNGKILNSRDKREGLEFEERRVVVIMETEGERERKRGFEFSWKKQ